MIQIPAQLIYFGLQSCLICGSYKVAEVEMCEKCLQKLERKINLVETSIVAKELAIHFSIFSLIKWIPTESDFLSKLFLHLKGEQKKHLWGFLAAAYLKELHCKNKTDLFTKDSVLVSCPSKTSRPDHAEQLAKALSEQLSIPNIPLLQWNKNNSIGFQKKMNRKERLKFKRDQHVKFTINPEFEESHSLAKTYIFVDDVVTTGATAMEAYMSLKKPKNFMGLTIGQRAFLASKSSIW